MDIGNLSTIVSLLVALSVASERLVEIIKGLVPFLNKENVDPKKEGWRRAALQFLAVLAGISSALLAHPGIKCIAPGTWSEWPGILALGFLASGGSGFWNSVLSYIANIKDVKKLDVMEKKRSITQ